MLTNVEIDDIISRKFGGGDMLFYCFTYLEAIHQEPKDYVMLFAFMQYKSVLAEIDAMERMKISLLRGNNGAK